MLAAVKGMIRGDAVIVENEDLRIYDGKEVIVTILDTVAKQKASIDWDSFVMPSERGKDVDAYMGEMRENDRL